MTDLVKDIAAGVAGSPQLHADIRSAIEREVERQIKARAGGEEIYIPKALSRQAIKARNGMIRAAWNGGNVRQLAIDFGLSAKQVRRIVRV